jgi:hypothetical protein
MPWPHNKKTRNGRPTARCHDHAQGPTKILAPLRRGSGTPARVDCMSIALRHQEEHQRRPPSDNTTRHSEDRRDVVDCLTALEEMSKGDSAVIGQWCDSEGRQDVDGLAAPRQRYQKELMRFPAPSRRDAATTYRRLTARCRDQAMRRHEIAGPRRDAATTHGRLTARCCSQATRGQERAGPRRDAVTMHSGLTARCHGCTMRKRQIAGLR